MGTIKAKYYNTIACMRKDCFRGLIKLLTKMNLRSKGGGMKGAGPNLGSDDVPVCCAVPQDGAAQYELLPRAPSHPRLT